MSHNRYAAHRAYTAPALPTAEFGRLVAGVILIELAYDILLEIFAAVLALISDDLIAGFSYGDSPLGLLVQLFSFLLLLIPVVVVARRLHGRGFQSLVGPWGASLRDFRRVLIAVALVFLASELLPPYWSGDTIADTRSPLVWLALAPLTLVALLVQSGTEELFYRGYVQQQVAARFDSPWIWLTLPNVLFALAHWDMGGALVHNAQYMLWAFCFGLAASDLTARTGAIGAAVGFHLVNNVYAFAFFAPLEGPDSGLALFLFAPMGEDALYDSLAETPLVSGPFLAEMAMVGLMWLAARVAIRR